MRWIVLTLFLAALVTDTYIYRSLIAVRVRRVRMRLWYIVFAVVSDGAALTALTIYGASGRGGHIGIVSVMWLVWLFFLTFVPKALYTVGGVADYGLGRILRRRVWPLRCAGLVLSAVVMTVMICGATVGRTRTRVKQVEVCSPRVPAAFDGYRIVQFSDVHIGTMMRPAAQLGRLAETVAGLGADMVVQTGDLVNISHEELSPELVAILGTIDAPDGVWGAWGNHDLGFYIRPGSGLTPEENFARLTEKIEATGWGMLSDRSTWIRRGGDSILLTGLDYPHDRRLNSHNETLAGADIGAAFERVEGDPFNVVLAHTPRLWGQIVERGRGDVVLSGHVHAMQTKLRLLRREWSPAQYMYDEWSGKYTSGGEQNGGQKNSMLYVNDGIGCVGYPMRIGARGEITVITLKRCE
ncbi:MAG: metallophosphoesterase [Alistipes sp.]|jgi:predicted MPP superfamily phosphohydrolase|nr:metallophosphoesterase [Alistipes sp.]